MKIIFSKNAFRGLSRLEKNIQKRISEKLDFYIAQDNPLDFADRLTDHQFSDWRFRIGEHRILFDVEKEKILILKIGHRKDVYK